MWENIFIYVNARENCFSIKISQITYSNINLSNILPSEKSYHSIGENTALSSPLHSALTSGENVCVRQTLKLNSTLKKEHAISWNPGACMTIFIIAWSRSGTDLPLKLFPPGYKSQKWVLMQTIFPTSLFFEGARRKSAIPGRTWFIYLPSSSHTLHLGDYHSIFNCISYCPGQSRSKRSGPPSGQEGGIGETSSHLGWWSVELDQGWVFSKCLWVLVWKRQFCLLITYFHAQSYFPHPAESTKITYLFGPLDPSLSRSRAGAFMRKKRLAAINTGFLQEELAQIS